MFLLNLNTHFIFSMKRGESFMAKENIIEGLIIEPNQFPRKLKIDNELSAFQKAVNGYIECIDLLMGRQSYATRKEKLTVNLLTVSYYDDTGEIIDIVAGNMVIVGFYANEGEFTSLSPERYEEVKQQFFCLDMFFKINDKLHMVNIDWLINFAKNGNDITFTDRNTGEIKHNIECDNDLEQISFFAFINGIRSEIIRGMSRDNSVVEISADNEPSTPYFDIYDEER